MKFYATLRKGEHSKTMGGTEAAGRKLGPFVETKRTSTSIESIDRQFAYSDWSITAE